ncbi:gag-pol polyprotein [Cucumis melo var. makuwa]|uniref:Gag-pol polyprotein n=1 Tax=Cucumis melo var. makuwa TaxID=1194695 RepID=A0A5D3B9V9_CUCMM|nr:gag-pol polyprotein [Cucumis melo var. makuwa]TYJ95666.1 gag-pol polyprotein [Cucumis melo var. makuwa]
MEIIREGPSTSRPPVLDGKNYSYWKPRMIFFIETLDGRAWRALVAGYDPPMITMNGVSVPKPEVDWTDAEEQSFVGNARALNAIFNGVDLNVFKLINSCSTAKEAWKTLEVAYEGTSKVKISRLQLITSKFEALRMTEDELVSDYNKRVLEIANEPLLLVIAIEEAHDITTLKLDELFGSLLTFEMATTDRESKKDKGITFKSTHVSDEALKLKEVQKDYDQTIKSVKMLNSGTENLDLILNLGHNSSSKYGLGFDASERSIKPTTETKFIPALVKDETETVPTTTVVNPLLKLQDGLVITVTSFLRLMLPVQLINLKSIHSFMEEKSFVQKVVLDGPPKGEAKVCGRCAYSVLGQRSSIFCFYDVPYASSDVVSGDADILKLYLLKLCSLDVGYPEVVSVEAMQFRCCFEVCCRLLFMLLFLLKLCSSYAVLNTGYKVEK